MTLVLRDAFAKAEASPTVDAPSFGLKVDHRPRPAGRARRRRVFVCHVDENVTSTALITPQVNPAASLAGDDNQSVIRFVCGQMAEPAFMQAIVGLRSANYDQDEEAPSELAVKLARSIAGSIARSNVFIEPDVLPMPEGGIALRYWSPTRRFATLEIFNDGEIMLALAGPGEGSRVMAIDRNAAVRPAVEQVRLQMQRA